MNSRKDLAKFNFLLSLSDITLAKIFAGIAEDRQMLITCYRRGLYDKEDVLDSLAKMSWYQNTINGIFAVRTANGIYD